MCVSALTPVEIYGQKKKEKKGGGGTKEALYPRESHSLVDHDRPPHPRPGLAGPGRVGNSFETRAGGNQSARCSPTPHTLALNSLAIL